MKREQMAAAARLVILAVVAVSVAVGGFVVFLVLRMPKHPVHTLKNGVMVKVLPVKPNEVMDVLEWKRWKFHATAPTTKGLQTEVELWHDGKYAQTLGGGGWGGGYGGTSNREFDITVYMRPEGGDWSKDARVITRVQFGTGSAITRISPNPYRNIQQVVGMGGPNGGMREGLPDDALSLETILYRPMDAPLRGGPPQVTDLSFSVILRMRPQSLPEDTPPAEPGFWQSLFAGRLPQ